MIQKAHRIGPLAGTPSGKSWPPRRGACLPPRQEISSRVSHGAGQKPPLLVGRGPGDDVRDCESGVRDTLIKVKQTYLH